MEEEHRTLMVTHEQVASVLPMADCINCMHDAFHALGSGNVHMPLRSLLGCACLFIDWPSERLRQHSACFLLKLLSTRPSYLLANHQIAWLCSLPGGNLFGVMPTVMTLPSGQSIFGLKSLSVFFSNMGTKYHSHQGAIILFEGHRGEMQAIVDAASVTQIRTAAVSGLATRLLAVSDQNGSRPLVCTILGAGVQAESHIEAMMCVRKIAKFVIWNRTEAKSHALVEKMKARGITVSFSVALTTRDAVKEADIICTVTASADPLFDRAWLKDGVHINAVGAATPKAREVDTHTMKAARVYADKKESLLSEAGDFIIPMHEGAFTESHVVGEIADLILGKVQGRTSDEEITVFKSLGLAVEDLASVKLVYDRCREKNLGSWIQMCEPPHQAKL